MINRELAFQGLINQVKIKIDESKDYLVGLIDSRNNDTKSSAGDKYETGRSMMQQEIDRAEDRLQQLKIQLNELERLSVKNVSSLCEKGAIVFLDEDVFLLGPAIGKIEVQEYILFSISMGSPLGQLLAGKKEGDEVQYRGKSTKIKKLI